MASGSPPSFAAKASMAAHRSSCSRCVIPSSKRSAEDRWTVAVSEVRDRTDHVAQSA
jgi:hypothetical protein